MENYAKRIVEARNVKEVTAKRYCISISKLNNDNPVVDLEYFAY